MKLDVIDCVKNAPASPSNLLRMAVLAIACLPVVASAQEPTLDETIEYVNWKLSECLLRPRLAVESSDLTIRQGKLEVMHELDRTTFDTRIYVRGDIVGHSTLAVNMRELSTEVDVDFGVDMSEIGAGVYDVLTIRCADETCFDVVDPGPDTQRMANEFDRIDNFPYRFSERRHSFYVCDSDDTPRVQRALAHLIRISGGREPPEELF